MPKSREISDFPMPKSRGGLDQRTPTVSADIDSPAPKGFFDDLPAASQARGGADLPAPKGFFDAQLAPAASQARGGADSPAPKGFFDDLPQPATGGFPGSRRSGSPRTQGLLR